MLLPRMAEYCIASWLESEAVVAADDGGLWLVQMQLHVFQPELLVARTAWKSSTCLAMAVEFFGAGTRSDTPEHDRVTCLHLGGLARFVGTRLRSVLAPGESYAISGNRSRYGRAYIVGDMRCAINVLQACNACNTPVHVPGESIPHDADIEQELITQEMIFDCIAAPHPGDIETIEQTLLNTPDVGSCLSTINALKKTKDLALADIFSAMGEQLAESEVPTQTRVA